MKMFLHKTPLVAALLASGLLLAQSTPTLEQATSAAGAGRTDEAIQIYRAILAQEPANMGALTGLSDALQSEGKWRDAVPLLEQIVRLDPADTAALYQLGRMKSWQNGNRAEALALLRRACEASGNGSDACSAYTEVLSWGADTRAEAIRRLRDTLDANPGDVNARLRLAQVLSWDESTRLQSLALYDEGLQRDPHNAALLLASAEVLSWRSSTRTEAMKRYEMVLQQLPTDAPALTGKAQLLAWQNHSAEAMAIYDRVLGADPANTVALRGKAELLNWKGDHRRARSLAERAHEQNPADPQASLELARADIGLQRFGDAREALQSVSGSSDPGLNDVRQEVSRALGRYVESGYAFRDEHGNLDYHRFNLALSAPVGLSSRVTFQYQPTLFSIPQQGFNSNYFAVALDSSPGERVTTHLHAGAETFHNAPVNGDGGAGVRFSVVPSTTLELAFNRQPVEESLLSYRGQFAGPLFLGQVRSNLGTVGITYENATHHYDLSLDYADGVYTGHHVDSNRRRSVDAQVGKALRGNRPFVRVAYSVNYTSFDRDADFQTAAPLSSLTGGYFSPTRFLLNQGVVNISHRFTSRLEWAMNGAAGAQQVETSTASFSNSQFASSFETHALWRPSPGNELRLGYDYLNVFNAFDRNLFQLSWRHYF